MNFNYRRWLDEAEKSREAYEESPDASASSWQALGCRDDFFGILCSTACYAEDLDPAVLKEVAVERESAADSSRLENSKGNCVTKAPVFIGVSRDNLPGAVLFFREHPNYGQTAREQPFSGQRPSQFAQQQRMSFHFDVVGDEAWPLLRGNSAGNCHRAFMIGVVGIEQRENCARIPENALPDVHASRIACLLRAPGAWRPPRPAPTRRKMGWSSAKGGRSPFALSRAAFRMVVRRTRRRPPRRTLGSSPRCIRRQSVERETPKVRTASSMVSRFAGIVPSYHGSLTVALVSFHRAAGRVALLNFNRTSTISGRPRLRAGCWPLGYRVCPRCLPPRACDTFRSSPLYVSGQCACGLEA